MTTTRSGPSTVVPGSAPRGTRPLARYGLGAVLLLAVYAVLAPLLFLTDDVVGDEGPLSRTRPAATAPPEGARIGLDEAATACRADPALGSADRLKIVAAQVSGQPLFACYGIGAGSDLTGAVVLDADGVVVKDTALLKQTGAWRYIGVVKTGLEVALGAVAMAVIPVFVWNYYRRPRPGPTTNGSFWQSRFVDAVLGVLGPLGWLVLAADRTRTTARKLRLVLMSVLGFTAFMTLVLFLQVTDHPDPLSYVAVGLLNAQLALSLVMGRTQIAPPDFGRPVTPGAGAAEVTSPSAAPAETDPAAGPALRPAPGSAAPPAPGARSGTDVAVKAPSELPTFADVGGMHGVKQELLDSVGLLLAFGEEADAYRVVFNGILLHGPPGSGKTFFAQALAGELGLRYIRVSVSDVVSKFVGESAQNIERVFSVAAANIPCLLFFDEFDSVAGRREDDPSEENRRVVNQLLTSLEQYRKLRELVVMAATNDIDGLDTAVIRPGRFDRRIRLDLPDAAARTAVLRAQLKGRPVSDDVDLDEIAQRTEGLSAATLASLVGEAAMTAFRETTATARQVPISTAHLLGALAARGGKDRPTVERWSWDHLVLDAEIKAELQQVQALVEDPSWAGAYGVDVPTGLLLTGPPGTGKTTIARVFAAEARCSFYPITAADLTSKWVGESEDNVARLFARARENAPSIIFIDEVDSIAGRRGSSGDPFANKLLNQLLAEIDGLSGGGRVFVMAATNRADVLDPALLRGGRLSRTMLIDLPGPEERRQLLAMFSARMPLHGVDLAAVAAATDGLAGADLEALCQQAAVAAMTRSRVGRSRDVTPRVTAADFDAALDTIREARRAGADPGATASVSDFLDRLTTAPKA